MSSQFQPYLEAICAAYEKRSCFYTQTDAEGRETVFDLMVETAEEEKRDASDRPKEREKIERLPVLEGLQKYASKHVLLVGRPGSGKSTALEQLLLELAKKAQEDVSSLIPVLVQLKADRPILPLVRETVRRHRLRLTDNELDDLLFNSKLLLLLDGVNEIPQETLRQNLQQFRDDNPNVSMVFTTRDLELGGTLGIEKKLKMQPLTSEQLKEFVGKYLPEQGKALLGQLNDRLKELAETPLLLKMLCDVFWFEGELPRSRGALFRTFDQKYEEIKGTVPVSADFRRFKSELLQHLAFGMLAGDALEPQLRLPRSEAEQRLEVLLTGRANAPGQVAKEWLEDLLEHHLLQVADDPKQVEFHHQLFLEYYAAEALLSRVARLGDEPLKREFLNYLKWTEPVALMLALMEDEAQALRVVKLALDVDWGLGARLAGVVKREFQGQTVRLIDALDAPNWLKVGLLGETRSENAIPGLLTRLEHSDSGVSWNAAEALGNIGSEAAIPGLLKLMEHSDSDVSWSAANALGKIGSEAAIPGLLKLMEHSDSDVRWSAANALGKIGSEAAIPGLLKLMEHSDSDVRWSAVEALGKISSEAAIPGLLKFVEHSYWLVRMSAANALGDIRSETAIPELLKLLEHSDDSDVRWRAANALGSIGSEVAAPGLLKLLEHSDDSDVRRNAADALHVIDFVMAVIPNLKVELSDSEVRGRAAEALGNIGSEAAIPELLKLVQDSDSTVRWRAVNALGSIGSEVAVPGLLKLMEHSGSDVRRRAAEALGKIAKKHPNTIAQHLPHLLTLIPTDSGQDAHRAILAIQENCKYYNYEIFQDYLKAQKHDRQKNETAIATTMIQQIERITIMTDKAPIFNQQNATIGNNYAAEGSNIAFTQHIDATEQNFEGLLTGYKQFIDELYQANPYFTDQAEIIKTIDVEARRIDARWQNFLNLKHLWNGGKKAAIKVGEHFVETNPWGKGAIAFLEGVSEDVK
jgi:HEAT repeat protein